MTPAPKLRALEGRRSAPKKDHLALWKAVGVVLSVLVGAGGAVWGLSSKLFVTREEYFRGQAVEAKNAVDLTSAVRGLEDAARKQAAATEALMRELASWRTDKKRR